MNSTHFRRALLLLFAFSFSLHSQTQPTTGIVVHAENVVPDEIASGIMPVPIYNFAIHNVAFSPDGTTLATGDGKGFVRLWDTASGQLAQTISAHSNWAFSVAWRHDGKAFATGGGDDLVHLFDASNPASPLKTFAGHSGDVHAVVITRNGRYIFSAGDDKRIVCWDVRNERAAQQWPAHDLQIPALALSPDEKILASGSRDDSIRLWDPRTGKRLDTLIGHSDDVMSVKFSPDGKTLASASYDQTVRLWQVATGKALRIFHGHTNRVFSVAFSPDGKRLASAGDSTLRIWNVEKGTRLKKISLGGQIASANGTITENLSSVAFSPDGTTLAVASTTGLAFLLAATGEVRHKLSSGE